ncbi:chlorophyll a-b binding protein chloroplastic [Phtheirospermum japonicum]|uniref:Chlorophyll a-b binding protein chloroplastic n=1 Tax=Phtheirospermum japonicum TaxID=374723 RepID=A0A830CQQ0_9LAMI|nr:chlorophyll a-b binding protein chloroplastic [Phtheirospermum japonicum]
MVRPRPCQIPRPILRRAPKLPHRRIPRRLRLKHRRAFSRPRNLRNPGRFGILEQRSVEQGLQVEKQAVVSGKGVLDINLKMMKIIRNNMRG